MFKWAYPGGPLSVEEALSKLPSYPEELGLDLRKAEDRFKWFVAAILFAKRISASIAKRTFRKFLEEGLTSPGAILEAGWDRLVEVLDSGGYVRYDYSTATNLLEAVKLLKERYGGDIDRLHREAKDPKDLERRLREFKGVGPTAVNIFLRELRGVWDKARPAPSRAALEVAGKLKLSDEKVRELEGKLVKLYIEYCKKGRCPSCPVKDHCSRSFRQV